MTWPGDVSKIDVLEPAARRALEENGLSQRVLQSELYFSAAKAAVPYLRPAPDNEAFEKKGPNKSRSQWHHLYPRRQGFRRGRGAGSPSDTVLTGLVGSFSEARR